VRDYAEGVSYVVGDRLQIEQVVVNLITNAIEALSSRPTPREIVISVVTADVSNIMVKIRDNGTGIDPTIISRLFDPFVTTKVSGIGLGLTICQSFIRNQNGKLWVSVGAHEGATLKFTLPTYAGEAPSEA
jgi:C4-dicarboxylate-specific signal transduction histidine kinase